MESFLDICLIETRRLLLEFVLVNFYEFDWRLNNVHHLESSKITTIQVLVTICTWLQPTSERIKYWYQQNKAWKLVHHIARNYSTIYDMYYCNLLNTTDVVPFYLKCEEKKNIYRDVFCHSYIEVFICLPSVPFLLTNVCTQTPFQQNNIYYNFQVLY